MAIRNFWAETNIDGYKTKLKGGPRNKNGGLEIRLYQRKNGDIVVAYDIECLADGDELVTRIKDRYGNIVNEFKSKR